MKRTHTQHSSAPHPVNRSFFSKGSQGKASTPFFSTLKTTPAKLNGVTAPPQTLNDGKTQIEDLEQQKTQDFAGQQPAAPPSVPTKIHPKLTVSQPDDPFEREADQVADQVMRMPEEPVHQGPDLEQPQEETVHRSIILRAANATHSAQDRQQELEAPPIVQAVLQSTGQPLETPTRAFMEPRFDQDFSQVRIHTDTRAGEAASTIDARAFTAGEDIVFAAGEYNPQSERGRSLLAHELTHVVQSSDTVSRKTNPNRHSSLHRSANNIIANNIIANNTIANHAIVQPTILRQSVPRAVNRHTAPQIFGTPAAIPPVVGMTLAQFKDYTQEQADWFVEPTLTAGDRNDLWRLLLLMEEGPHIRSGVGDVQLADLRTLTPANWTSLRAFCRGTHGSQHTVRIFAPFPVLGDRITLGQTLLSLEATIPAAVLEVTVSQSQLLQLQTQALLPSLSTYWNDYQPHLEETFTPAPNQRGAEFDRVLAFLNSLGAAGLAQLAPLRGANPNERWVRNLHRFPLPMLLRLVANLGSTSGAKRLVLVLHTGHDAPAAFQESATLFSNLVLNSPNNLVLMIEGATSLAAITTRIPTITSTWGQLVGGVRRISQLLIAGHGSAQTVGMARTGAPTVTNGSVSYPEESLDISNPIARATTQALLDALLQHMDPAQARILFAGCLVGSTHVAAGTAAANIPAALTTHQSLGAFTEARAVAAGIPAGRVRAARASVALASATSLFNSATGNLALNYPFDPNAFGSASTYASTGHEPEGVLRAAVEVGANNRITAETLLRTRLGMAAVANDWYDQITRLLVNLALPAAAGSGIDLQRVNELANIAEIPFLAFWQQFNIVPAHFVNRLNPQPFAQAVYTGVAAAAQYTTPTVHQTERMRIIVDQGWLALAGAAQAPTLLAGILATGLSADAFEPFLDLTVLAPQAVPLLPAGVPTVEQIRLALAWFSSDSTNAHVRSFLTAQVQQPANAPAVFNAPVSTEIAASGRTDREILDQLGFPATATAAPTGGSTTRLPFANLSLPGAATNTLLVRGRIYEATITAQPNAIVRRNPAQPNVGIMSLGHGATVRVMGFVGSWAAVDVWGQLGFIQQSDLSAPPP